MIDSTDLLDLIEERIAGLNLPSSLPGLYQPIRYTMESGGKRLRPMLLMASCQAMGVNPNEALNQAVGLEMFHNFTLLHDDVMDRADTRRGRPTVHAKWNDTTAILSGDTMLTLATQLMCMAPVEKLPRVMQIFNRTAIEVYEGQQMDMDFEARTDVSEAEYLEMIRLKTSVLLGCACELGALMADAGEVQIKGLYDFAENLGIAFQLQDDYLDTFGSTEVFGKEVGGDILNNKKTWLLIKALEEEPQEVAKVMAMPRSSAKVEAMTEIYNDLRLPALIHDLIDDYATRAIECLDTVNMSTVDSNWFAALTRSLSTRTS
jgi:geranylgeranyl diphosphate synthase type II